MDKQRIGLIGALLIVAIALIGGVYLTAHGQAVPGWLATLATIVGSGFALYAKPPGDAAKEEPKP